MGYGLREWEGVLATCRPPTLCSKIDSCARKQQRCASCTYSWATKGRKIYRSLRLSRAARKNRRDVLDVTTSGQSDVVITRYGKPVTVMIRYEDSLAIRDELLRVCAEESEAFQTMLASEAVLARDWNTPEEDDAWADLWGSCSPDRSASAEIVYACAAMKANRSSNDMSAAHTVIASCSAWLNAAPAYVRIDASSAPATPLSPLR